MLLRDICWNPKILELQSAIWSDYKHHNTVEFPVCVDPNSKIFLSKAYTRKASYEAIILQSCFYIHDLDIVIYWQTKD